MSRADGSGGGSRPSKNNCYADAQGGESPESKSGPAGCGNDREQRERSCPEAVEPGDLTGGLTPLSVTEGVTLRDEALLVKNEHGQRAPLTAPNAEPDEGRVISRPWYRVVNQHTEWYTDYRDSHIEYESPDGETVRAPMENSYQPGYGDRYYARLMDLRRGLLRRWDDFTIVMLTLSASTVTESGQPVPPADHMRAIAGGWGTARQHLYNVLSGEWCYARVWEPTSNDGRGPEGYGHMHVALFVRDTDSGARDFEPVMRSYVRNCAPAGWDAHRPEGDAVSVTPRDELEEANAATYISEYIGQYGDELHERPMHERAFLATAWATNTRRVEFNSTAQDIIRGEEFRRETGLRPSDRGGAESDRETAQSDGESDGEGEGEGWTFGRLCTVSGGEPNYYTPLSATVSTTAIDGSGGMDLKDLGPPPD